MGRRGLRPIRGDIDLSRHLYVLEEMERFDPSVIFGREAPLEIEIGSGKGMFLLSASAEHPDRDFVGIEVAANYARFAAARLAKRDRRNAVVISGDALRFFREFLPDNSVDAVHVYFPDPWWKARHRKRRVMVPPFLTSIERVLKPGGELQFWTDVHEYFQESLELLAEHTRLEGPPPVPEREPQHDMDYRTNFERRVRQAGKPVYRAQFIKRAG
mgnify:FL=1